MRLLPFEYAVRNLGRSPVRLIASILGGMLVVLLVVAAGAFVRGMEKSLTVSGNEKNVILLGAGSEESLERSQIGMNVPTQVAASVDGIRRRLDTDYVSPEVHMALVVKSERDEKADYQAVVRGIMENAFLVHPQVQIVEGRPPQSGKYEILVGALAATRLDIAPSKLALGESLWFDNRAWRICGRFTAPQTVMDAEIWVPLNDLQIATRRNSLSCVILTLDEATITDVSVWAAQRLDLELVALRERDYYASLSNFYRPIRMMIWTTAVLIALGGLFGGLNTMYAAFGTRVRELAALQTIGYPRRALIVSFLQESMLITSIGAVIAIAIAVIFLDGLAVRFSMGAFALLVDARVMTFGLIAGLMLAIVGVIPPLCRCLWLPIVEALRTG